VTKGGAIYIEGLLDEKRSSSVKSLKPHFVIKQCEFDTNEAGTIGGAISAIGSPSFDVKISGCRFKSNAGGTGGGAIGVQGEMSSRIENSAFIDNDAGNGGAVIVFDEAVVAIDESKFDSNTARFGGSLAQDLKGRRRGEKKKRKKEKKNHYELNLILLIFRKFPCQRLRIYQRRGGV